MEEIVNRVAKSPLQTLNLEDFYTHGNRILFDIKDNLFQGLILKEKDFREFLKTHSWEKYQDAFVAITCSVDAIVPTWAYMLLAVHLEPFAKKIVFGNLIQLEEVLFREAIHKINPSDYADAKVVIKGCSKIDVPVAIYVEISQKLRPFVQSLMYGEPCSTVPLYKKLNSSPAK